MAIFKCKMCGGALDVNNETVAVCQYCGTKQTLPKLDDDRKANLYDRANHFRRNNEFDKAMGIYEQILNDDNTDAETYWSLVLCRYGIEYVEDPSSHKRIPTVNRAQFTSIFDDEDYKSAIQYADGYQKDIYEQEATAINDIQKGILAISSLEEPFDVFICYKETDNSGLRSPDSVLATELYNELTREGFKVFFARITLEDKLGQEYEPYIFAALNSAKVMVVLGTKPEYFNAVWVKNEWSRYLALIKNGARKMLIPAYKDMDPYDLPEEFSHLQAQDMSKLGFMQDLIRGVKKVVSEETVEIKKETVVTNSQPAVAPLLERAFMFLEDGDWQSADEYCEKVLDQDPKNARAYLGKLMAELKVNKESELSKLKETFENNGNYQKVIRFADNELKDFLVNCNKEIIYTQAKRIKGYALYEEDFKEAEKLFKTVSGYKDADILATECTEKAETTRKDSIYQKAIGYTRNSSIESQESAINLFESILLWKDSENQIALCKQRIEEIKVQEETDRLEKERKVEEERIAKENRKKKNKKIVKMTTSFIAILILLATLLNTFIIPSIKYNSALDLMDTNNYEDAIVAFAKLNGFKNSEEQIKKCQLAITKRKYGEAFNLMNSGEYKEAIAIFDTLDGYEDSITQIENCYINIYGEKLYNKIKNTNIGDIYFLGSYEQDNIQSNGKENIEWIVVAKENLSLCLVSKYALDCRVYNDFDANVTWESCVLRNWLNNYFFINAFSTEEKTMIATTTVPADKNPDYATDQGNATQDKVFLLSRTEVEKYFPSNNSKQCKATAYAETRGYVASAVTEDDGNCNWWLRTLGHNQVDATYVNNQGNIRGAYIDCANHITIRPALWLTLD